MSRFPYVPHLVSLHRRKKKNVADPLNNVSSPYRGKNYKLLKEMITMAAVRAYRSELRISGDRYTLNWLEKFVHRNDAEGGPNLKVHWVGSVSYTHLTLPTKA